MAIYLQEVECVAEGAQKFAVFIDYHRVTESEAQLDFHQCGCKSSCRRVGYWLHTSESTHSATCDQVNFGTFKSGVVTGRVCVDKKDHERGLNGEVIDQFRGLRLCSVSEQAPRASTAHLVDVAEHVWPIITKPDAMQSPRDIQVPPSWV